MSGQSELFMQQLERLGEEHFLVLLWAAMSADRNRKYNITNCFDDLKAGGITRTKQTAVAVVEAMHLLCLIDVKDERNRKNIYLTNFGGQALAKLAESGRFQSKKSHFLEETC
ncbi:MAG: hypothetical protein ACI4Q0_05065 [Oligosphaeraceae bacterium]